MVAVPSIGAPLPFASFACCARYLSIFHEHQFLPQDLFLVTDGKDLALGLSQSAALFYLLGWTFHFFFVGLCAVRRWLERHGPAGGSTCEDPQLGQRAAQRRLRMGLFWAFWRRHRECHNTQLKAPRRPFEVLRQRWGQATWHKWRQKNSENYKSIRSL